MTIEDATRAVRHRAVRALAQPGAGGRRQCRLLTAITPGGGSGMTGSRPPTAMPR